MANSQKKQISIHRLLTEFLLCTRQCAKTTIVQSELILTWPDLPEIFCLLKGKYLNKVFYPPKSIYIILESDTKEKRKNLPIWWKHHYFFFFFKARGRWQLWNVVAKICVWKRDLVKLKVPHKSCIDPMKWNLTEIMV